jgi:N-acetylneuraminate lyase
MTIKKTKGLIAAPFTGMNAQGGIAINNVSSYAAHLKKMKVKGAFVAGTTGEGLFLSDNERLDVINAWVACKESDFRLIAHAGSTSLASAKTLAYESAKAGADAIAIMGPPFLGPNQEENLVEFCADVALSAPDIPFYYYHMPSLSRVNVSMSKFLSLAKSRIPNLAGIKFTDNNLMEMSNCLSMDDGKWDILHGYDELLLAGLSFGAQGAVGSTYNFLAPLYYGIIEDFENGRITEARAKQRKSIEFIDILIRYHGALVSGKAIMGLIGVSCGPCRKPLGNLTPEETRNLERELSDLGFFEMIESY